MDLVCPGGFRGRAARRSRIVYRQPGSQPRHVLCYRLVIHVGILVWSQAALQPDVPAGHIEVGGAPEAASQRELLEQTDRIEDHSPHVAERDRGNASKPAKVAFLPRPAP